MRFFSRTKEKAVAKLELVRETTTSILLNADVSQGGWLVLADAWYPGWNVSIDGRSGKLHPADYLFRAVKVPERMVPHMAM